MCDRCAGGLWFFGIAEPQTAMLESYRAALVTGRWQPAGINGSLLETLRVLDADPIAFIAQRRDRIDAAPSRLQLTRWMWDGEFCGEIRMSFGSGSVADCKLEISLVPWKSGHDYEMRARRQLVDELTALGIDAVKAAEMLAQQPTIPVHVT